MNSFIGKYWTALTVFRWQLTTYIMIFLRVYSHFQVMILLMVSYAYQIMIAYGKPMENTADNTSTLFNEVMVSVYLYIMMCLMISTDSNNDILGWALVGTIFISVVFNFLKFAIILLIDGWTFIRRRWRLMVLKRRAK